LLLLVVELYYKTYQNLQAEITSAQISSLLQATGNTEVEAFYPIIFANYLSNPAKVAALIASPGSGSGGGT
jgi:large subunit ribosomal protein LP1